MKQRLKLAVALFALAAILILKPAFWTMGDGDFRGYWSASYLLSHSRSFSDPAELLQVEREQTGWRGDFVVSSWNPPWLLALLIPYTLIPFSLATWWWFLTNLALTFAATLLLWSLLGRQAKTPHYRWLALLVAFTFSPTLMTFLAGQVSVLILLGLVLFLHFWSKEQFGRAGLALVLTLVKPHLVYLTIPLILLEAARLRYWRLLAGLAAGLASLTAVVFLLRPTFLAEYLQDTGQGRLLQWLTPTLGGILDATFGWSWAKFMGVVILPLAVAIWWRYHRRANIQTFVDVTLLISIITAPFGWSYDVVILLVPILHLFVWIVEGQFGRLETAALIILFFLLNAASLYHRVHALSEEEFFWFPIALALLYAWGRLRLGKRSAILQDISLEHALPTNG